MAAHQAHDLKVIGSNPISARRKISNFSSLREVKNISIMKEQPSL